MESYAAPIRLLAEDLKWFVRATEVRCLHVTAETDLRKAILTLIAAQEMHPANKAPFFVLEEPFVETDDGWSARVDRLRVHHVERQKAFAKEAITLEDLAPRPAREAPIADFVAQLTQLHVTRAPFNEGLVIVLAPTQVHDPIAWSAAVEALVMAPTLSDIRWIVVDMEVPTPGAWLDALGTRAMRTRCAVDEAAAQREFGKMLDTIEAVPEGVSGPARTGAAWPRGITPPSRAEYPVATPAEIEASLASAGVSMPAMARLGQTLGLKVLRASQAMRQRRDADALRLQREARDLCLEHDMVRDAVVMEMILASFLVPMERRNEAIELYAQAATRADARSLGALSAQAHLGRAALLVLERRREEAIAAYQLAAERAEGADQKMLAIEAWRMAGQLRLDMRDERGATACWQRALSVADAAPLPEAKASSAGEVAAALAVVCRAQGLEAQAAMLDEKARSLLAQETQQEVSP